MLSISLSDFRDYDCAFFDDASIVDASSPIEITESVCDVGWSV